MAEDPWADLAAEGNFDLINRLQRAEKREPGFRTIVVTRAGFSDNDRTHNKVTRWIKSKGIRLFNPMHEIENLKLALKNKDCY